MQKRRTLAREVSAKGVTLHAGVPVQMRLCPAAAETGIRFRRGDLPKSAPIPALWSYVAESKLGTVLQGTDGATVAVTEHLLAALSGAGIDDCLIELDGAELPVLAGDALSFLALIDQAGTQELDRPRPALRLRKQVEAGSATASARLLPSAGPEFFFEIEFSSALIGRQIFTCAFNEATFRREIAPAHTFGFLQEAEELRRAGYGRGADFTNTLVIDGDRLCNPELQRFRDEFVRHKILDAIGDLKLAGAPLIARFEGRRSSHALNNALLRALFSDSGNYEWGAA